MAKTIFEEMGGTYARQGDYLLPCLFLPAEKEKKPIGVWGQRHLRYLKQHRKVLYTNLLTSGKLNSYLADIDEQAEDLFFRLVNSFFACRRNRSFPFLPFNKLFCLSAYLMPCFVKDAVSILAGHIFCITYRIILSITRFLRRLHDIFFCSDIGLLNMVCHCNCLIPRFNVVVVLAVPPF